MLDQRTTDNEPWQFLLNAKERASEFGYANSAIIMVKYGRGRANEVDTMLMQLPPALIIIFQGQPLPPVQRARATDDKAK